MAKILPGLGSSGAHITHLGCVKSCLRFLGAQISDGWLYGGSGHAFITNVSPVLCPSGPTAWRTMMLHQLGRNLGYRTTGVFGWKHELEATFRAKQREAFEFVRAAIDAGLPCYGWQMQVPDFYVICGYDDTGYYYSGYGQPIAGPLPWDRLGDWDVELIEVYRLELSEPATDREVVGRAIAAVLDVTDNASQWAYHGYTAGPDGFETWARALETGEASHGGHIYNAQAWGECRRYAVEFLQEAKERLPGLCTEGIDRAIACYSWSRDGLAEMLKQYLPHANLDVATPLQSREAAAIARQVGTAEREGIAALRAVAQGL